MQADVFDCQKQQIWPYRKHQGLLFSHCESFRPRFSYEKPSALFDRRRKPKANYLPPNRYLPKLVVWCPWLVNDATDNTKFEWAGFLKRSYSLVTEDTIDVVLAKCTACVSSRLQIKRTLLQSSTLSITTHHTAVQFCLKLLYQGSEICGTVYYAAKFVCRIVHYAHANVLLRNMRKLFLYYH